MVSGPRVARSRSSAAASVASTSPRLPPSPRATGTALDLLVVQVLFLFLGVEVGVQAGPLQVLFRDVLNRDVVFDLQGLRDLRLTLLARRLADRGALVALGVLLVGAALGAERLGLAEIVEPRAAVVALVFRTQVELWHGCSYTVGGDRSF